MSGIQEFNSQSLEFRCGYQFAFIVIDNKILTCINEGEVFRTLDDQVNAVLHIEDEGRGPVHHVVDIALRCSTNYQVIVLH